MMLLHFLQAAAASAINTGSIPLLATLLHKPALLPASVLQLSLLLARVLQLPAGPGSGWLVLSLLGAELLQIIALLGSYFGDSFVLSAGLSLPA